ncbi:hypothetical protein EC991_003756 [Linnemannia zychae]|nr:hypothetical protein EC991_003756 [Linnemannia zychae]
MSDNNNTTNNNNTNESNLPLQCMRPFPVRGMTMQQQGRNICVPTTFNAILGRRVVMLEAIYAALENPNRISLFFSNNGLPVPRHAGPDGNYINFDRNRILMYRVEQDDSTHTSNDDYHQEAYQYAQDRQGTLSTEFPSSEQSSSPEAVSSPPRHLIPVEELAMNRTNTTGAHAADETIEHGGQQRDRRLSWSGPTSTNAIAPVHSEVSYFSMRHQHVELRPLESRSIAHHQQQQPLGPLLAAPVFNLPYQRHRVLPIPTPVQSTPSSPPSQLQQQQEPDTSVPGLAPVPDSILLFNSRNYPGLVYRVGMRVGRVFRWLDELDGDDVYFGPEFDMVPPPFHGLSPILSDLGEGESEYGDRSMRGDDEENEERDLEEQQNYPIAEDVDAEYQNQIDEDDETKVDDDDDETKVNEEEDYQGDVGQLAFTEYRDEHEDQDEDEVMGQESVNICSSLDGRQQDPVIREEHSEEDGATDQDQRQEQGQGLEGMIEEQSLSAPDASSPSSALQEEKIVVKLDEQSPTIHGEVLIKQEEHEAKSAFQGNPDPMNRESEEDSEGSLSTLDERDCSRSVSPRDKDSHDVEEVEPPVTVLPKRKRSNKKDDDDDESRTKKASKRKDDGGGGSGGCEGSAPGTRHRGRRNK